MGRWWGVGLRVHVIFPMWAIAEIVGGLNQRNLGPVHALAMCGAFVMAVAYRELGRVAAARALGGVMPAIELWPLGGLSSSRARVNEREGVLSELGGILAGGVALPLLAAAVVLSGAGWDALRFNPVQPGVTAGGLRTVWQVAAWWAYYANAVVLLSNLLLPMGSFDLGRILARRLSPVAAGRIGVVVGLALFVAAASVGLSRVVALAMIGVVASWLEMQRGGHVPAAWRAEAAEPLWGPTLAREAAGEDAACAAAGEEDSGVDDSRPMTDVPSDGPGDDAGEARNEDEIAAVMAPRLGGQLAPEPTLDEVLARISAAGIANLDSAAWRVLERETKRLKMADEATLNDGGVVAAE